MITRRPFGTMPDGSGVDEFTLSNSNGLALSVIPYGAIVTRLLVPDRAGALADIVCGFDSLKPYLAGQPYFGCIAGRVAGRITRGRFALDGAEYQLALNDPPNHLHGGNIGFDKRLWSAEITGSALKLTYFSPDGEEGYPGNARVCATFALTDADEFILQIEATTDAPTPLSLTHHGYFNLSGAGGGTIHNHMLQIFADDYAPADESMALLGRRAPVAGANDFRQPKRIGAALEEIWKQHGDLYFANQNSKSEPISAAHQNVKSEPKIIAKLYEAKSCRAMTIRSTEPCLQLYTGVALDGSLVGKSGRRYEKHNAVCLECERYPNGVNQPQLGDIILRPGKTYRQTTIHAFSIE